jgi:hypothetical protein
MLTLKGQDLKERRVTTGQLERVVKRFIARSAAIYFEPYPEDEWLCVLEAEHMPLFLDALTCVSDLRSGYLYQPNPAGSR